MYKSQTQQTISDPVKILIKHVEKTEDTNSLGLAYLK